MDCKEAKERLVGLLTGDISRKEKRNLFAHLTACSACSQEKEGLERVWAALGALPEIEVPGDLREAAISTVEETFKVEQTDRLQGKRAWEDWFPKPLAAVFAGLAMAFFSLWVLRRVTSFEQIDHEVVIHFSALWTGILVAIFLLASGSLPALSSKWLRASRIGLLSLGLTMLGTLFCPKMNLIEWWEMLPPGQLLLTFGKAISHGSFGIIYAFLPFFLALLIFGRRAEGELVWQAMIAGAVFLLLLLPVIYLQALPLSVDVFFSWAGGSVLGALMGALSGAGICRVGSWKLAHGT